MCPIQLTILMLTVGAAAILAVLLFLMVVIGIRRESPMAELSERAPGLAAMLARRVLGVYVSKPDSPITLDRGDTGRASPHSALGR